MTETRPTLGMPVEFTHTLRRSKAGRHHEWRAEDAHYVTGLGNAVPGILIGIRTLANGNVIDPVGDDGPDGFHPTEHFTAYLIAYHLRRSPVLVLPEHVTLNTERLS